MIIDRKTSDFSGPFKPFPSGDISCYYCHHELARWGVTWIGHGEQVFLHPHCVVEVTIRMYRDLHEIELVDRNAVVDTRGYTG